MKVANVVVVGKGVATREHSRIASSCAHTLTHSYERSQWLEPQSAMLKKPVFRKVFRDLTEGCNLRVKTLWRPDFHLTVLLYVEQTYRGRSDLADASIFSNWTYFVDEPKRVGKFLPTGLKDRALRWWNKLVGS